MAQFLIETEEDSATSSKGNDQPTVKHILLSVGIYTDFKTGDYWNGYYSEKSSIHSCDNDSGIIFRLLKPTK